MKRRNPVEGVQSESGLNSKRIPIGSPRLKMKAYNVPEGYKEMWVNDIDNRLQEYKNAGYEFVTQDMGISVGEGDVESTMGVDSRVSHVVATDNRNGKPVNAYLMMVKQEWWDEDKARKQEKPDQIDRAIYDQVKQPGMYGKIGNEVDRRRPKTNFGRQLE